MTSIRIPGQDEVLTLPPDLLDNMRMVHGAKPVEDWHASLPTRLSGILDWLGARIMPGNPPLSYHLVFFAELKDRTPIVVKTTTPNNEQPSELAAVQALADAGIGPDLLWHDLEQGTLVMRRVMPGKILPTELPSLEEDAKIAHALATRSRALSEINPSPRQRESLIPVRTYSRAIFEVDPSSELWHAHRDDILLAQRIREELLEPSESVVLHGDLHHYNVLTKLDNTLSVIDPKGLIGPPAYDFGAFTYNPVGIQHHPDLQAIERQRIDVWSRVTGIEWEIVRHWGYVAAVLSACWSGQGGVLGWRHAMTVATTLRDLEPALN